MRGAFAAVLVVGCGRVGFAPQAAFDAGGAGGDAIDGGASVPPGPVLWLPMDDAPVGGRVRDVARDHVVSCTTCPVPVAGRVGGALRFAASRNDYLTVPYTPDLDASAGYTVAAWVYFDARPGMNDFTCFVSKPFGAGDANSYALCVQSDGGAQFFSSDTSVNSFVASAPIAVATWHHVAMSWDGAVKRGYVAGIRVTVDPVGIAADQSSLLVAADLSAGSALYKLTGALDEVMVYPRALSDAEIAMLAAR